MAVVEAGAMSKEIYEENKRLKSRLALMEQALRDKVDSDADLSRRVADMALRSIEAFMTGRAYLSIRPDQCGGFDVNFVGPDHWT